YLGCYQVDCDIVLPALGDDDIAETLCRLDELEMHRADNRQILVDDGIHRPAAFFDIPLHAAQDPDIRISIDIKFHIHQIPEYFIFEGKNPLDDDYIPRFDENRPVTSRMDFIIVCRHFHGLPVQKLPDVRNEQVVVEREGMIVVGLKTL